MRDDKYGNDDHIYKVELPDLYEFASRWGNEEVDYTVHDPAVIAKLAEVHGQNLGERFRTVYAPRQASDGNYLRASMLGKHALIILSQKFLSGVSEPSDVPRKAKSTMAVGTFWEYIAMMELELEGWEVRECQQDLELFEGMVSGHPDAIVTSPNGTKMVLEFKTMNSRYFSEVSSKRGDGMNDDRGYITQLSLYAEGLQLPAAWVCFNKDTSELYVEQLSKRKSEKAFKRASRLIELWGKVECWDDMFKYCKIPEPIPEIYQSERTGRYFVPYDFRGTVVGDWIYETSEEKNGYGSFVNYVTSISYPEQHHEKQRHLHDEYGHLIDFASGD